MNYRVNKPYISHEGKRLKAGDTVTLDDERANRIVRHWGSGFITPITDDDDETYETVPEPVDPPVKTNKSKKKK